MIVDAFNLQSNSLQSITPETTIRLQNDIPRSLTASSEYRHSSLNSVRISESIPGDLSFPALTSIQRRQKMGSKGLIETSKILLKSGDDTSLTRTSSISNMMEVMSAVLLITGNTVGAGIMVLPEVVAGPGMTMSIYLFVGCYIINLLSGLLIAEVAMHQYNTGCDVPSSFKAFTESSLPDFPQVSNAIAFISIFVNWCVLAFGFSAATNHVQSPIIAAAVFGTLVATQTNKSLSNLASVCVTMLFIAFAGMLLPGLFMHSDSLGSMDWSIHTSSETFWAEITSAAPILVSAMVYQNIVPSITKLLNYDRTKTTVAIALGSFLPMAMYIAWSYGVLSGAVSTTGGDSSLTGLLYSTFSIFSICGCSIACIMSIAEEFESFLNASEVHPLLKLFSPNNNDELCEVDNEGAIYHTISDEQMGGSVLSVPSVVLAVTPALIAAILFSNSSDSGNFTAALSASGGYGSPLLYGVIPIILAATQRYSNQSEHDEVSVEESSPNNTNFTPLVPGGAFTLGIVGFSSCAFFMQEAFNDVTACFASVA